MTSFCDYGRISALALRLPYAKHKRPPRKERPKERKKWGKEKTTPNKERQKNLLNVKLRPFTESVGFL